MTHAFRDSPGPRASSPVECVPGLSAPPAPRDGLSSLRQRRAPYAAFARRWAGAVAMEGAGFWLSRHSGTFGRPRWMRRHFVLVWSVLHMFEGDRPGDRCCAAVDIRHADVQKAERAGRVAIVITPVTPMWPEELSTGENARFTVYFSAERLVDVWLEALRMISTATRASASKTSGALLHVASDKKEQEHQDSPQGERGVELHAKEKRKEENEKEECKRGRGKQSSLNERGKPSPNQQLLHVQEVDDQIDKDDDVALGVRTPKRSDIRLPQTDDTSPSKDPSAIIESYRQQLQSLTVNAETVKQRISRVVASKEPSHLAEVLLRFVMTNVDNAAALWGLMSEVEELPETDRHTELECVHLMNASGESNTKDGGVWQLKGKLKTACPPDVTPIAVEESQVLSLDDRKKSNNERFRMLGLNDTDTHEKDKINDTETSSLMNDFVWRRRMQRVHARRSMVESLLDDLPNL